MILELRDLVCGFRGGFAIALDHLCLDRRDKVAVMGANGVGKTTLLRTVCGVIPPVRGRVLVCGGDVHAMTAAQRARAVAMLPQSLPADPDITVREWVRLGRTAYADRWGRLGPEDERAVEDALDMCDVTHLAARPLGRISGGERQRAHLALVLAQEAPLLLLDEPTTHLDMVHRRAVHAVVDAVRIQRRTAVITVCHSPQDAWHFGDRVLWLDRSGSHRVFDRGQVEDFYAFLRDTLHLPAAWIY